MICGDRPIRRGWQRFSIRDEFSKGGQNRLPKPCTRFKTKRTCTIHTTEIDGHKKTQSTKITCNVHFKRDGVIRCWTFIGTTVCVFSWMDEQRPFQTVWLYFHIFLWLEFQPILVPINVSGRLMRELTTEDKGRAFLDGLVSVSLLKVWEGHRSC